MAARLTHIAISAVTPRIMKTFYSNVFGFRPISPNPDGFLTDGYINFAFNYRKTGYQAGLDHFGFEVDDVDEVKRRIAELYPTVDVTNRPAVRGYVGMASHDPEGHCFDLTYTEMGEQRRKNIMKEGGQDKTTRHFHHLAMRVLDPPKVAKFYQDVFDLAVAKQPGPDGVQHLTDGELIFEIMPWKIRDYAECGIVERPNLDHIGISVESIEAYKADLAAHVAEFPEAAPWADKRDQERLRNERAARERLLETCEYNESQLWDPECCFFDVIERKA